MRSNVEQYLLFVINMAKAVVGVKVWKQNSRKLNLSDFFTITDEAFLLLCVENYRDKWIEECEELLTPDDEPQVSKAVRTLINI